MNDKTHDILERIEEYCGKISAAESKYFPDRASFDEEQFYQDGCAFYIQQIGELIKGLPDSFTETHAEIKWHQIRGFRNIIAHAYGNVDIDILWEAIQQDIPKLRAFCEEKLDKA